MCSTSDSPAPTFFELGTSWRTLLDVLNAEGRGRPWRRRCAVSGGVQFSAVQLLRRRLPLHPAGVKFGIFVARLLTSDRRSDADSSLSQSALCRVGCIQQTTRTTSHKLSVFLRVVCIMHKELKAASNNLPSLGSQNHASTLGIPTAAKFRFALSSDRYLLVEGNSPYTLLRGGFGGPGWAP